MHVTALSLSVFASTLLLAGVSLGTEPPQQHLERLLTRFDAATGRSRDALEKEIDAFAGQRYATWSRLYWYRDLEEAKGLARATGRPILSLRMLGRLDQELSCANSRFFRVALYANPQVSKYLREHYVLHWSSERPAPVARIDMGDGRVLTRTVAGNSAHFILDARGRPVDVLTGLYSPALFEERLRAVESVAQRAGTLDDATQAAVVAAFHRASQQLPQARLAQLGELEKLGRQGRLAVGARLVDGELVTLSKATLEVSLVQTLQLGMPMNVGELQQWDRNQKLWEGLGALLAKRLGETGLHPQTRALMAAMEPTDWSAPGQSLTDAKMGVLLAAFELRMNADAAFNELLLHTTVHAWFADAKVPFTLTQLNQRLYTELFRTPADDPWLGMSTPDVFTGLPRDGVSSSH